MTYIWSDESNQESCGPEWPRVLVTPRWVWGLGQFHVSCVINAKERIMVELSEEQSVTAEVRPLTGKGNVAPIHGEVAWEVTDPTVVSLEVDPTDSKKAKFTALAGDGARPCDVTAKFDADLGDGVREITGIGQIVVKDAEAQTAEIAFGTPE